MTIAVTGATGFVGQALLDRAGAEGVAVRALARRPQAPRELVDWITGDLGNPPRLAELMEGAETVIHVAGVVSGSAEAFEEGNVAGTLNVIEAAKKAGVPRLVFVSSLSAREPQLSAYGASKARGEKLVMASGLDWTIVRPPAIYGPRDKEMLELFKVAKWGVIPMPQALGRASYIHVDDLASLLLALVPGSEAASGKLFEPDDGQPGGWSHGEIARAIGSAAGRRPFVLHLAPQWLARAAWLLGKVQGAKAKLTPDRASYMSHPDWVVSDDARPPASLWTPAIATRDGLKATADWYRAQKWL